MTQLNVILAEDEAPQRAELRRMLQESCPDFHIVAECADGLEALEAIERHKPDVAFLDIRMPGVSGLEVARAAAPTSQVVFTTAYDEYAVKAFDNGAIDYLLKPIKRDRLLVAADRIRRRRSTAGSTDMANVLAALERRLGSQARRDAIKWITATIGNTTKMFAVEEVLYFQAHEKYTRVVTASDEAIIRTTLKELLDGLDSSEFWQIHRSAIVRVAMIQSVHRGEEGRLALRIRGKSELLPVSSAFHYRFKGM